MSNFDVGKIRNVAVIAHGGAGKTSLAEAMLFSTGAIDRLGSVVDGNTTTDFEPEEIERKITLSSSVAQCLWKNHRINIIDTPGFINFLEDTKGVIRVSDGAVVLVSAVSGVKPETRKVWKFAEEFMVPKIVFVNEMDRDAANFSKAVEDAEKFFGAEAVPLEAPIGSGEGLGGTVDIVSMKAFVVEGGKTKEAEIPVEMSEEAGLWRKKLIEKIAESDDALLERYLEGGEITGDEIMKGLKEGVMKGSLIPVFSGSATRNIGVSGLLDAILLYLPSPAEMGLLRPISGKDPKTGNEVKRLPEEKEPLSAYVFKTVADPYAGRLTLFRVFSGTLKADSTVFNSTTGAKERIGQVSFLLGKKQIPAQAVGPGDIAVVAKLKETNTGDTLSDESNQMVFEKVRFAEPIISYAIEPKTRGDEEKVSSGIQRILEEDPTLKFHREEETKEMLISGMGQVHLEVTLEKLKRKFGVEVLMKTPKIPYRETITAKTTVQGKYKKQSGGRGQYGDCWIEVEPLPRGGGFEFVDNVVGGAIPRQYIPAVEKGIVDAMREGIVAGAPMVDVRVRLFDGSYHAVDSSEMAFKIAGSLAIKKAALEAKPALLEPMMKVEVMTPEDTLGSVIGDLNSKRGKVQGVEAQPGGVQRITALVPMAELLIYANQLHSLTSGRGIYSMEFSHYEEMPVHIAQKIIEERQKKEEEK